MFCKILDRLFRLEKKINDCLPEKSEDEQLHLLAKNGMLVKRTIVFDKEYILVRFKEDE